MRQFFARQFFASLDWLASVRHLLAQCPKTLPLTDVHAGFVTPTLQRLRELCESLEFQSVVTDIDRVSQEIRLGVGRLSNERAIILLSSIQTRADEAMGSGAFAFIPASKARWHSGLIGEAGAFIRIPMPVATWQHEGLPAAIISAFPSAAPELQWARDCFATGNPTACVFHLMRAMEVGLGALATVFGVTAADTNWATVIDQVESKVRRMHEDPAWGDERAARKQKQRSYAAAVAHIGIVKDAWRNHIMHGRTLYSEVEADLLRLSVEAFLARLAEDLTEEVAG